MAMRIEDYAMIGDCRTAALVGRDGSIDWLCVPRFDSGACFAALLGTPENGRWKLAPADEVEVRKVARRYRPGSLVLETEFTTDSGAVRITDAMAIDSPTPTIVRVVEGLRGEVPMRSELVDPVRLRLDRPVGDAPRRGDLGDRRARHAAAALLGRAPRRGLRDGRRVHRPGGAEGPVHPGLAPVDRARRRPGSTPRASIHDADAWWRAWSRPLRRRPELRRTRPCVRSLITLKALTYAPTGGIVAAPTTSLPEKIGGVRNWDYRFCWLRDATFTLLRADRRRLPRRGARLARVAAPRRRRPAREPPDHVRPGRRAAADRVRARLAARLRGLEAGPGRQRRLRPVPARRLRRGRSTPCTRPAATASATSTTPGGWARSSSSSSRTAWKEPDEGIWEVRGERRHFTHSKVMAWVAFDRAVKAVEQFGYSTSTVERWQAARDAIHDEVCEKGFDAGARTRSSSRTARRTSTPAC